MLNLEKCILNVTPNVQITLYQTEYSKLHDELLTFEVN